MMRGKYEKFLGPLELELEIYHSIFIIHLFALQIHYRLTNRTFPNQLIMLNKNIDEDLKEVDMKL